MKPLIKAFAGCLVALLWSCLLYAQPNITRVEYYLDNDPGYNNATAITITPGINLSNIAFNINPASLTAGVHILGIRAKDANGAWSQDNRWLFAKPYASDTTVPGPIPNLNRVEYYLDGDPGYGKATSVSFTTGTNLSDIALNLNPATLTAGVHILGIRARDANGGWSHDNRLIFAKPYASDTTGPGSLPNITKVEYYLDTDPGYSAATAVSISTSTNLSNLTVNIDTASITQGVHILGIRAKDANGGWSQDNRWLFARPFAGDSTGPGPLPALKQTEYYIDTDPGYGNATQVATENVTNLSSFSLSVNISDLATGSHTLFIRSKDANNAWSLDNTFAFTVSAAVALPSITLNSVSKKTLCAGDVFSVGFDAKGTFNTANTFTVQLSDGAGSFASPTAIGSVSGKISAVVTCTLPATLSTATAYKVRVVSSSPAATSNASADALNITAKPLTPTISAGGATTFCQGGSVTLTATTASGYVWSNGATTQSTSVSVSGNYTVTVANSNGCTSTSAATAVIVNPKPQPVITASGLTTICSGSSVTLNAGIGYSSYAWSNGATVQTIAVTTAGSYTVTVTNSNGCAGTSAAKTVTVVANPTPTTTPSGSVTIPAGGNVTIAVTSTYASYLWSNGATTQSITVSAAGSYTVTVANSNGCTGTSAPVVVSVATCAKPTITASGSVTNVCAGKKITLTASAGTSYQWSTGATTQKITVSAAGSYYVIEPSACGNVMSDTTVVTYQTCANPTGLLTSNITASAVTFTWTVVPCATKYNVQYKKSSVSTYTTVVATGTSTTVTGLTANTVYNWRVQTVCTTPKSGYTNGTNFKTAVSLTVAITDINGKMKGAFTAMVYPNPAAGQALLRIDGAMKPVSIALADMAGKIIWQSQRTSETQIGLPIGNLSAGIYTVTVTDGIVTRMVKLVKE